MPKKHIGPSTSPKDEPGYPLVESGNDNIWTHIERYWIGQGSAVASLPAFKATTNQHGETILDPDGAQLYCYGRRISTRAPGVNTVELTFTRDAPGRIRAADNPRTVGIRQTQEIPIDDKRLLTTNDGPFTVLQVADFKTAKYKTLPIYSTEYTYTDTDASFAWTQAAIVAALQDTGTPTGMGSATASKWRLLGRDVSEESDTTIIVSRWEYMPSGFVAITT